MSESAIELQLARKLPLKMEKFVSTDGGGGGAENGFRNAAAPQREREKWKGNRITESDE